MPRQVKSSKTTTSETESAPTVAPVVAPVVDAAAPVSDKPKRAPRAKKSEVAAPVDVAPAALLLLPLLRSPTLLMLRLMLLLPSNQLSSLLSSNNLVFSFLL